MQSMGHSQGVPLAPFLSPIIHARPPYAHCTSKWDFIKFYHAKMHLDACVRRLALPRLAPYLTFLQRCRCPSIPPWTHRTPHALGPPHPRSLSTLLPAAPLPLVHSPSFPSSGPCIIRHRPQAPTYSPAHTASLQVCMLAFSMTLTELCPARAV